MAFEDWSTTPIDNSTQPGINWAEGMQPKDINGSARKMMADLALALQGLPRSVKSFGAKGGGVVDDTAAIQSALNSGYSIYFPFDNYLISGQLVVGANNVIIDGGGSTIKAKNASNFEYMLLATGRSGVIVRDFRFDANKAGRIAGQTIRMMGAGFSNCTECFFEKVFVYNARGYNDGSAVGIVLAGGSARCNAIGCGVSNSGDAGNSPATDCDAFFTSGEQNIIADCFAYNCTDTGAVIESSSRSIISGFTATLCGAVAGVTSANASDKSGNVLVGVTGFNWKSAVGAIQLGIPGGYAGNLLHTVVSDVVLVAETPTYGTPGPAILIAGTAGYGYADGVSMNNVRIRGAVTQGIIVQRGRGVRISDSYVTATGDSCVQFNQGSGHAVIDCELAGGSYGIFTQGDARCLARDNDIHDQTAGGLYASGTSRILHRGNSFDNMGGVAIQLGGTAVIPGSVVTLTYGTSVVVPALNGPEFSLAVTNTSPFTIESPTPNGTFANGDRLTITVKNASGGVMGAVTWAAGYALAPFVNPANGFNCSITFRYDGSLWSEISRSSTAVPN